MSSAPTLASDTRPSRAVPRHRVKCASSDTDWVVKAAWTVLERSRFQSLKVTQVVAASEMSASAFYRRFPSKAALVLVLLQSELDAFAARLTRCVDSHDDPPAQVRAWIRAVVRVAYDDRMARRAQLWFDPELLRTFPDELDRAASLVTEPLAGAIAKGQRRRCFNSISPTEQARTIFQLCIGAIVHANGFGHRRGFDEESASIVDLALRALNSEAMACGPRIG